MNLYPLLTNTHTFSLWDKKNHPVGSWRPSTACLSMCLPFALSLSLAATAEHPRSIGNQPDSVTAAHWTSCLLLFLMSYLLLHIFCPPPCERGSDRAPGGSKLISTHTAVGGFLFVYMCLTGQPGHKPPPCELWELYCFCVDRQTRGRRTVKVRGCSVWDAAGQTQLDKQ